MAEGFNHRSLPELASLLSHSDQRVRQSSQFAMVKRGNDSIDQFKKIIEDSDQPFLPNFMQYGDLDSLLAWVMKRSKLFFCLY